MTAPMKTILTVAALQEAREGRLVDSGE